MTDATQNSGIPPKEGQAMTMWSPFERNGYSETSRRLAEALGRKAAGNLSRAGYDVHRDPVSGHWSFTRKADAAWKVDS